MILVRAHNSAIFSLIFWLLIIIYYLVKMARNFSLRYFRSLKYPDLIIHRRNKCDEFLLSMSILMTFQS